MQMRFDNEATIIANGDYPTAATPLQVLSRSAYVVCCDGGADQYIALGHRPDAIVGDGDSISEQTLECYADIIHHDADQQTNDQTKAVKFLIEKGFRRIAIVGATGRCEDHTIGNIALLAEYQRMGVEVRSYTDYGVFIPCTGECEFECRKGQKVSIFNISAKELTSKWLEYPIYDFTAWWQGTLNRTTAERFTISAQGEYIVFINY